jgi:hypothetical protein
MNTDQTKKRVFDVYGIGDYNGQKIKFKKGRYVTRDPAGSAKKAFSQIIRFNNITSGSIIVAIQERTRNSNNKIKIYNVERYLLQTPKIFKKDTPKEYTIKYDTHIKTNTTFQLKDLNTDYEAEEEVEEEKNKDTETKIQTTKKTD